ncbi:hypothetical protein RhiirA5_421274 [Rhizophagus irregularis]|uniref:Uncharacterized protein n=1 Tax=Rhizophagus irregularis TaxID=588596 RepID=A0A2N0PEB4_9GLOM|nr:hypothetical protein RhiirA5_421274 [Rhizophagus irregularis]
MSAIRKSLIYAAINRAFALTDYNIYNKRHKQVEFQKQIILADESLTKDEKSEAVRKLTKVYDSSKIVFNKGIRRVCENCNQKCLATLYSKNTNLTVELGFKDVIVELKRRAPSEEEVIKLLKYTTIEIYK